MSTDGSERVRGKILETDRLALRVVEYPDAPDRCTVYPLGLGDHERMTHWISADRDAFVSLALQR